MSLIKLSDNFSILAEGDYVFKINKVDYDETFGKLSILMSTQKGENYTERYNFLDNSGKTNEIAIKSFSFMARLCLGNDIQEVDPMNLVGHFIQATVEHEVVESKKEAGKMLTFVKLVDKKSCNGWDGVKAEEPAKPTTNDIDLDDILG